MGSHLSFHLQAADFIGARHQSVSTGVFSAHRTFKTEGQTFSKEHEDDASQLNRLFFATLVVFWSYIFRLALSKFYGQAEWAISTRKLRTLPRFYSEPINLVVFQGPS